MSRQQPSIDDSANRFARTADEAFADSGRYLRSIPEEEWSGPTGCSEWTIRDLAGHIVGEAVWFPNLVRGVTRGEHPLPSELYEEMKSWSSAQLTDRIEEAAAEIRAAVEEATSEQLRQPVDMGFMHMPMWRATFVSAVEAVFHNWDARARREPAATIPTEWAATIGAAIHYMAPIVASKEGAAEAAGRYLLHVGDGVGPVTITARDGNVTVEQGEADMPDVTLHLTADQYGRLVAGRLNVAEALERGEMTVEGDHTRATGLNRIFQGV